ncbi:MAG: hypothetical protein EHM24_24090, partial [Acidobacteria bacterium]
MAVVLSGTGQYYTLASGLGLTANGAYWVALQTWIDSTAVAQGFLSVGVSGSGNNRRIVGYASANGGFFAQAINNVGTGALTPGIAGTAGMWNGVVAEFGSATSRACQVNNGTRQTSATSNSLSVAPNQIRLGASHTGTGLLDGRLATVGIWSGVPTADQRAALFAGAHPLLVSPSTLLEAWDLTTPAVLTGWRGNVLTATGSPTMLDSPAIYLPRGRSLVAVPAAGGGGGAVTLPTEAGAYAITGSDASLRRGRIVLTDPTAGTYLLAGSPATLPRGRRGQTDAGLYTLTGSGADLATIGARTLSTAIGVYALTGSPADLRRLRALALTTEVGAYVVAGSAAPIAVGRILATASGTYFVVGSPAPLERPSASLVADPGGYLLAGAAATLRLRARISAEAGAYAITGAAVDLVAVRAWLTEPGTYDLTGAPTHLDYSGAKFYTVLLVAAARAGTVATTAQAG